jgi:hypothetical protein
MGIELNFLNVGLGIAVLVGVVWCIYSLADRSDARRKPDAVSKKTARQPWDDGRTHGRGNR